MADDFSTYGTALDSPASNAIAVTPGVSALGNVTRALYVGAAGDVEVTMAGGGDVTFSGVSAGTIIPIRATHVLTAAGGSVIALW